MLKSLVDSQAASNFILILDTEDEKGQDVFVSFLKNHTENTSYKSINLICYEQPPEFYLKSFPTNNVLKVHNFFHDSQSWIKSNLPKPDIFSVLSTSSDSVIFIDSLTHLIKYFGYYKIYKQLSVLKSSAKKLIILGHFDILNEKQLEELKFLSSAVVKLKNSNCGERIIELFYRKPGGKVIIQEEVVNVSPDFKVSSLVKKEERVLKPVGDVEDIESLTTFKLGVKMSDNERKARDELVLPYLRSGEKAGRGEIIYVQEAEDDLEDDPDDDLDI